MKNPFNLAQAAEQKRIEAIQKKAGDCATLMLKSVYDCEIVYNIDELRGAANIIVSKCDNYKEDELKDLKEQVTSKITEIKNTTFKEYYNKTLNDTKIIKP